VGNATRNARYLAFGLILWRGVLVVDISAPTIQTYD
jgi:hypothetical protein